MAQKRELKGVLDEKSLLHLLATQPPLVQGLLDPSQQVQPNGIDLTLAGVALISSRGQIGHGNEERRLAGTTPLAFDSLGFMELMPGCYLITFSEILHLPRGVMALGRTRSSLLRCGVAFHTAVWDAGYSGRSQSLMVVYNPYGFRLARNARVLQLVFFPLAEEVEEGYSGVFQRENL